MDLEKSIDTAVLTDSDEGGEVDRVREFLPIVVVADTSSSMSGTSIDTMNRALENLRVGLTNHPMAGAMTRLAVIEFNSSASVVTEIAEIKEISSIPALMSRGATSYWAACDLLMQKLPEWLKPLSTGGSKVLRPTIFWFTDGGPTDPDALWRAGVDRLTDPDLSWAPNIVAFGIGAADPEVLTTLSRRRGKAFLAQHGQDVSNSLNAIVPAILHSVISSVTPPGQTAGGSSAARPAPIPTAVPGMIPLDHVTVA